VVLGCAKLNRDNTEKRLQVLATQCLSWSNAAHSTQVDCWLELGETISEAHQIRYSTAKKARTLLPLGCGKLGTDNTEMGPLGHFHKYEY
jgi:hypothetical protein